MIRVPLSLLAASLSGARLSGKPDALVRRLSADSRDIRPGDLFACIRGAHADGHDFALRAVRAGAVAVLADREVPGLEAAGAGVVTVDRVAPALQQLAPRFYNHPSLQLRMVGVTGTSGKTTVTHLIRSIVHAQPAAPGRPSEAGLIGTIRHEFAGRAVPSHNTTPPAWDLQALLRQMADHGCDTVVMEVSSHALAQGRAEDCEFDVAVFTNLSREHLDFHGSMEEYAAAKQKLFARLAQPGLKTGPKHAVVNADDPAGARMAQAAAGAGILTYGLKNRALITADEVRLTPKFTAFTLVTPQGRAAVRLPLLGQYNLANALAAAAAGLALGASVRAIKRGLESVAVVPGRLDRVPGPQPFTVLVDFAHKPDALEQVLSAVRRFTDKRVIVVFGCGGDRDPGKRAPMGEIAARLADEVVLTSDNPRSEDPQAILAQIGTGCRKAGKSCRVEADRTRAIRLALSLARRGDTVILAGKGHETYQIFKDKTVAFDDRRVAARELARMGWKSKKRRKS